MVEFDFTATADLSYLIVKVQFDAPVEINAINVTRTENPLQDILPSCACDVDPAVGADSGEDDSSNDEEAGSQDVEVFEGSKAECIKYNCDEQLTRCAGDDVCARLFPKVCLVFSGRSGVVRTCGFTIFPLSSAF